MRCSCFENAAILRLVRLPAGFSGLLRSRIACRPSCKHGNLKKEFKADIEGNKEKLHPVSGLGEALTNDVSDIHVKCQR